jgi:hypothetical protein
VAQLAIVEAGVELTVAHLLERCAGDFVLELDLDQRVALHSGAEKLADADELRVGHRAYPRHARDLSLDRVRLVAKRMGSRQQLLGIGDEALAGSGQLHPARLTLEQVEP